MASAPASLWLVNATGDFSALPVLCQQAREAAQPVSILCRPADHPAILAASSAAGFVTVVECRDAPFVLPGPASGEILFLPCSARIAWADLQSRPPLPHPHCLQPLFANPPPVDSPSYVAGPLGWWGWRAGAELAARLFREPSVWNAEGFELVEAIQRWPDPPRWQSIPFRGFPLPESPAPVAPELTRSSSVLAVISFFGCEPWLHACLASMSQQTRPPENIVVIDDGSPELPLKILEPFPNVTLLSTATPHIGPEKILNNIIKATAYDAYMVQDPDDWSAHDRLELSLLAAERTGAALVGTHEVRVDLPARKLELCVYPPDVNRAMAREIGHCLLHCTGLFSRSLALRLGGFAEHLKLVADMDFVMRAWHAGRIVNLPAFCLFHRIRSGSLTSHAQTGYQSSARLLEDAFTLMRARRNAALARAGKMPDIRVRQKVPLGFIHRHGPALRLSPRGLEPGL